MLFTNLAPIILFVYNRPWHTSQVLDSLAANTEAKDCVLYVYCDGPKNNTDYNVVQKIEETRVIIRNESRFKNIIIIEQSSNKGLANSIIDGVTEVLNTHDKAIILEDDILAAKGFLKYMNEALTVYEKEDNVGCIHAWTPELGPLDYKEFTFFLKGGDCWGWATWKESWKFFEKDGEKLRTLIKSRNLEYSFNRNGTEEFLGMLQDQITGKNDSWAIRWHASLFLENRYCLHPVNPLVKNIGLDGSGTHCVESIVEQNIVDYIPVKKLPVEESDWYFFAYKKSKRSNSLIKRISIRVRKTIQNIANSSIRHF